MINKETLEITFTRKVPKGKCCNPNENICFALVSVSSSLFAEGAKYCVVHGKHVFPKQGNYMKLDECKKACEQAKEERS